MALPSHLNMNTPTIIIVHQDVPGMIAHVTEALSRYDINIAQMNVTREKAGEKAIMIIEVDSRSCEVSDRRYPSNSSSS